MGQQLSPGSEREEMLRMAEMKDKLESQRSATKDVVEISDEDVIAKTWPSSAWEDL